MPEFCRKYDLHPQKAFAALLLLERYGLVKLSEGFTPRSKVHITVPRADLYAFEVQNPRYTALIRQLLRWYGGITSGPTAIDERALASSISIPGVSVRKQLNNLAAMGAIEYLPAMGGHGLEWVMPRMESKYLPINKKELAQLQNEAQERVNKIIYFAYHKKECRFAMLLDYFGEKSGRCGHCDNCLSSKNTAPTVAIDKALESLLRNNSLPWQTIEKELNAYDAMDLKRALGLLLDEGYIVRGEDGRYLWRSR